MAGYVIRATMCVPLLIIFFIAATICLPFWLVEPCGDK